MAKEQLVTADQVQQHSEAENCWVVIDGQVWDVAEFAPEHPGGAAGKTMLEHLFTYPG
jgi:L-lactate dehydrogenase (cytochrome)